MIISRTPFRVSLFGGGTDYPAWFREHGGAVLGGSIDKYCYISARYLPPHFDHLSRIVYSKEEWVNNNREIEHPAVRECLKFLGITRGMEISHSSDLLARRGMGTSSAFVVGLLHALMSFERSNVNKERLANLAIKVEQDWIKENVGCQDQYHSAVGGFNLLKFKPNGGVEITPFEGHQLEPYLMLFDTGNTRIASHIAQAQIALIPRKQSELEQMGALTHGAAVALTAGKIEDVARMLNESWQIKRGLSDKITTSEIDGLYHTALSAGAWGGKLLGAGGGGHILFIVEPDKQGKVIKALDGLRLVPFKFEDTGSQIIFRDDEVPVRTGWGEESNSR